MKTKTLKTALALSAMMISASLHAECRPESGMGCYIAKYSADGKCLVKPWRISGIESRPVMTVWDGKLYAFYNADPNVLTPEGRKASRSRMRISQIDRFTIPVRSWDITSGQGIQYFNVVGHGGGLYLTFVSGRTPRDYRQFKGDISFGKLDL